MVKVWWMVGSSYGRVKPKAKIGICFFPTKQEIFKERSKTGGSESDNMWNEYVYP